MNKRAGRIAVFVIALIGGCRRIGADSFFIGQTCADRNCGPGTTCVEEARPNGVPYAACAIGNGGADTRCTLGDDDVTYCDGNAWVRCHGRFREEVIECGAELCASRGAVAKCVPTLEPNPSCDADVRASTFCKGDELFDCFGPWENNRLGSCAEDGGFCRAGSCVLRPDPDPRCTRAGGNDTHTFCDGNLAVACFDAFHIAEQDCAQTHRRCVDDGDRVRCVE